MGITLLEQIGENVRPGPDYQALSESATVHSQPPVRLIAFFFSQASSPVRGGVPSWLEVTRALPRFIGHYQPRLPGALGFYDARSSGTLRRQAAMARRFGVSGFCFRYDRNPPSPPAKSSLEVMLENPDIDFPFCVSWEAGMAPSAGADGGASEDDAALPKLIEPILRDRRYMDVGGRPLLIIDRAGDLQNAQAMVAAWRAHLRSAGVGDPYVVALQSVESLDPRPYGMDAAAAFPPRGAGPDMPPPKNIILDPDFHGRVRSYDQVVADALAVRPDGFRLFPGVCPQWDDEPRHPGSGTSFRGATPAKYGDWLAAACGQARQAPIPDERIVFVNAWNDWANGAYLEPDRRFGHAYLVETARVLQDLDSDPGRRPSAGQDCDAPPTGAQASPLLRRMANLAADAADELARRLRTA